ncbi:hypothetical protein [Streptococcus parauberis]|uniref:hypothetical protein n=1 Tax=Streptococcus parauberis TaxID=1348 RepID=UPI000E302574|nr:hypothetical protein [Streptococcus parauberis]RFE01065.1 hypothetical protein ADO06_01938 [Streptococcus parauberis]
MDKNQMIFSFIVGLVTALGTYWAAFWKFRGQKVEVNSSSEKLFIESMQTIIENYQNDMKTMKVDIINLKDDVGKLKAEIEEKDKIIDDLRNKLRDKIAEIKFLKEKLNGFEEIRGLGKTNIN